MVVFMVLRLGSKIWMGCKNQKLELEFSEVFRYGAKASFFDVLWRAKQFCFPAVSTACGQYIFWLTSSTSSRAGLSEKMVDCTNK
jgi:hypothetical protein